MTAKRSYTVGHFLAVSLPDIPAHTAQELEDWLNDETNDLATVNKHFGYAISATVTDSDGAEYLIMAGHPDTDEED